MQHKRTKTAWWVWDWQVTAPQALRMIILTNHAHGRYKLYPMTCELLREFTRPIYAHQTEWDMTGTFTGVSSYFYQTNAILPLYSFMWNTQFIFYTSIFHWNCNICGTMSWERFRKQNQGNETPDHWLLVTISTSPATSSSCIKVMYASERLLIWKKVNTILDIFSHTKPLRVLWIKRNLLRNLQVPCLTYWQNRSYWIL